MPLVNFDPNDATLLSSRTDLDKMGFLKRNLDAFLTIYDEQGKIYWLRYLISFREHLYKHEYKNMFNIPMCKHQITYICDEAFIVLHKEFIECSKTKKVKSLLWDMIIIVIYYFHFQHSFPTSLNNNPFHCIETKSAFTRLFGCNERFTHPMSKSLMDILVAPIFMILSGNFYNMLQRWKLEKKTPPSGAENIKNWVYPPEWTSHKFLPNRFERYITCFYGNNFEKELGLDPSKQILIFEERPKEPKTPFSDKNYQVLNCICIEKKADIEIFFKKFILNENAPYDVGPECNHTKEDIDNIDYMDNYNSEIEDIADLIHVNCPACYEEAKKTILFKLAKEKFKKEQNADKVDKTKTNSLKGSKKKKKKNLKTNPEARFLEDVLHDKDVGDEEGAVGYVLEKSVVTDQVIRRCKEVGYEGDIDRITENIKKIETHVKTHSKIDPKHFDLMFKTGDMLKVPSKTKTKPSQSTAKLDKPATKFDVDFTVTLGTARFCSNCHKMKNETLKLKKCSLCVKENIAKVRYYCNRDCQAQDWSKCHKDEHEKRTLPRNSS